MAPLATETPPFDPPPPRDWRGRWGGDLNGVTWIRPELVIRAELGGWTRDGHVRQTSFKGIEVGRDPRLVVREHAVSSEKAVAAAEAEALPETDEPEESDNSGMSTRQAPRGRSGTKRSTPTAKATPGRAAKSAPAAKSGPTAKSTPAAKSSSAVGTKPSSRTTKGANGLPASAEPSELERLGSMPIEGVWHVGGTRGDDLKLTNLDKVLFGSPPSDPDGKGVTKRELIAYFARIAPVMLAHLDERPLNLHRFPNGADGPRDTHTCRSSTAGLVRTSWRMRRSGAYRWSSRRMHRCSSSALRRRRLRR